MADQELRYLNFGSHFMNYAVAMQICTSGS